MAPTSHTKRKSEDEARRPKKKPRIKRQTDYHSSEDEEAEADEDIYLHLQPTRTGANTVTPKSILKTRLQKPKPDPAEAEPTSGEEDVELDEVDRNTALNVVADDEEQEASDAEQDSDAESDSEPAESEDGVSITSSAATKAKKKRNDPDAFATSISKILSTKLTQPKRLDPILSRSKETAATTQRVADAKLDHKARAVLRAEKKQALEKGRVKDVLALERPNVDTGALLEQEKRLKKTAQRGVVRLFNAVRAAQVKAAEGMKQARDEGVVGMQKREETINEMSKQGFLDMISLGGKKVGAGA
ncbi:Rrp15p-domain-containing protein [Neohortaea acidophila]|uniref:Rrp15p-domain-containing protein n=1 Tax=Neohortaea acidophila TaxID=245834 RepID=A0A6A6PWK3_9PEZI|nr:Rrp15p-domain-containing protein [Neohortaea acidophila]KAF2483677.1 Rrp15p-domain-containing protein [Neohortaea acidophila]